MLRYRITIHLLVLFLFLVLLLHTAATSFATPEYSERSGQGCLTCHVSKEGGGKLTRKGLEFASSGYKWPPVGGLRVLGPIRKSVRLVIGLIHIVFSFLWFGTILYVHIMLRPGYASRGLPKGEAALGLISMTLVGISGMLLTISRIRSIDVLFSTHWGVLLTLKIVFYLIMVSSALFTVLFVGPKLDNLKTKVKIPHNKVFDTLTLAMFDGKNGMPAYVAYKGKVYDVSNSKLWENGIHMKHRAGCDLSSFIAKAPHGEEKIKDLPVIGLYDASLKPPKTFAQKAFYFIAYMNLIIVFIVLAVIAYWRWGL